MDTLFAAIRDPGTVIVAIAGLVGTVFAGWYQSRKAHQSQLAVLQATQQREDQLRERQFKESDNADRLMIIEYIDLLLPRLCEITSIYFLAGGPINKDQQERDLFRRLHAFMNSVHIDPAHPERTLSLRLAFLLFQLLAAMRAALNARWLRPLSTGQVRFLSHYEDHLEPIFCSGRYPGEEFLYREQIDIISDEMLIAKQQGIIRPLNWKEFCDKYSQGGVLRTLTDLVADKLRFIFDDTEPRTTAPRRSAQARLAILALYLIHMSEEAGESGWTRRADRIWHVVTSWFAWEQEKGQNPQWFVFKRGDVTEWIDRHPEAPPKL
jgi:hypothetical protein